MAEPKFIIAYKLQMPNNNWYGSGAAYTLDDAQAKMARLERDPRNRMVAIFYSHVWNYGLPTAEPRYLMDRTDKSRWPIQGCSSIVNDRDSSWF